ncbi:putative inactive receptor kinase isoform X1 [Iris pallida]|uniref:Inactive receptor kinase isoform X1 n=1 Tax=Iris pallida TaxID=29817 RepID=A0AAX6DR35_IRIPA|nr:putative inactive receptor kinase isoform X1 [Iris pallida]
MELLLLLLLMLLLLARTSSADPSADAQALLDFASRVGHRRALGWSASLPVCTNWTGVTCGPDRSRVVAVHLPGVGFAGPIPPNTLSRLSALQTLSLRSNNLLGPFPADFANLTSLTSLHLQLNSLSGPLPPDLSPWRNLTVLDLSYNAFTGSVPASLSNLTALVSLNLSNNSLSGDLPDLRLPSLRFLDLSNNSLTGTIPADLLRFPSSSFAGNAFAPVLPLVPSTPSPLPPAGAADRRRRKLGESAILGITVGGFTLLFAASVLCMVVFFRGKGRGGGGEDYASGKAAKASRSSSSPKAVGGNRDESNRLVFFDGCNFVFDLEDLLRASAEVLGKGTFGTAYRAVLEDATMVVVKRLKEVGVGKREFEQQMETVGRIRHENVVELRAYYYSKDEKLMVYDFYSQGSVSSLLHGKRGEERVPLDWETRLKIALGTAKGVAHIHTENGGKFVHGNIKSSNIFLNTQRFGCVSDLGLSSLSTNAVVPRVSRTAGYRAPEVVDARRPMQASDVYSFGVLVLELLTGKSPIQITGGGDEVVHLVRWVQSVVREEWTAEVFDMELMRYPNIEEELVEMLQVGMACVVRTPEQRPKMAEVVRMIEDVRRFDTGNRPSVEVKVGESSGTTPGGLVQGSTGSASPVQ